METTLNTLKQLWNTANDLNAWKYSDLERAITALRTLKTTDVQAIGKALGLHRKLNKSETVEAIHHMIGERRARCERGQVIANAARRQEEVYEVELVA